MPNAIFIDTSNLNTLYKVNSRFAMGVSYASCPEKLTIDAQALGTSFDVYLSVWPRQQGEGDDIINYYPGGGNRENNLFDEGCARRGQHLHL